MSCFQSTPTLSLDTFPAKKILICIWVRHFAALVSQLQQRVMVNALPICVMVSHCLPGIFSAPLKASWKSNNSVTLLVHLVNVCHLFCPVNQSAPGRANNVRKGTKTFSHCCVFLDFNEKDSFFLIFFCA